jgi:hypothetical protein
VASSWRRRPILKTLLCQGARHSLTPRRSWPRYILKRSTANLVLSRLSIAGRSAFRWRPPTTSRRARVHQFRTHQERAAPVDKGHATLTLTSRQPVQDSSSGAASINIARFFHLLILVRGGDSSIEFQFCALERSNRLIYVRISKTFVL